MATVAVHPKKKAVAHIKKTHKAAKRKPINAPREVPAGEFKAKCLALIDEVDKLGRELVITKRGRPAAKLIPVPWSGKKQPIIGRLVGIGEIVGDPDDLLRPVFPPEDYDMLK